MFHFSWINSKAWFCCLLCIASLALPGCGGGSDDRGNGSTRNLNPGDTDPDPGDTDGGDTDTDAPAAITDAAFKTALTSSSGTWQAISTIKVTADYTEATDEDEDDSFPISAAGTIEKVQAFTVNTGGDTTQQDHCDLKGSTDISNVEPKDLFDNVFENSAQDSTEQVVYVSCDAEDQTFEFFEVDASQLMAKAYCSGELVADVLLTKLSNATAFSGNSLDFVLGTDVNNTLDKTNDVCGQMSFGTLKASYGAEIQEYLDTLGIPPLKTNLRISEITVIAPFLNSSYVELSFNFSSMFQDGTYRVDPFGTLVGTDRQVSIFLVTGALNGGMVTGYSVTAGTLTLEGVTNKVAKGIFDLKITTTDSTVQETLTGSFMLNLDTTVDTPAGSSALAF